MARLQTEVPRNWVASLSGQSANGAREQSRDTSHRRQPMPRAAAIACEQAFEWFASKPNIMQFQRGSRLATAIEQDETSRIDFAAYGIATLELTLDPMSATVL